jgi:hypothetical protein
MVVLTNSQCTANGAFQTGFSQFITNCASPADDSAMNNIIKPSDITEIITREKAIEQDLLTSLTGIRDLRSLGGVNGADLVGKVTDLNSQIEKLEKEKSDNESKTDVQNQIFLQTVTDAPKKSTSLANLNDVALGIFFGSIFIFTIIINIVQATKVNGSITMGLYTLIGMIVVTIIVYALVKQVA